MQTGVCAILLRHPALAGLSLACGASLATVLALASRAVQPVRPPQSMPRAFMGLVLTVLLAIGLTLGGMLPGLMRGSSGSGGDTAGPPSKPGMPGDGRPDLPDASAGNFADSGFPGVILWPEVKPIQR